MALRYVFVELSSRMEGTCGGMGTCGGLSFWGVVSLLGWVFEARDLKGRVSPKSPRPERPPFVEGLKGSTFFKPAKPSRPDVDRFSAAGVGEVAGPFGSVPARARLLR